MERLEELTICRKALNKFGDEAQMDMAIEEMAELTKELCKFKRFPDTYDIESVREEIADVEIMIIQMKMLFGRTDDVMEKKLTRLQKIVGD